MYKKHINNLSRNDIFAYVSVWMKSGITGTLGMHCCRLGGGALHLSIDLFSRACSLIDMASSVHVKDSC